jgi:hypothetical protein
MAQRGGSRQWLDEAVSEKSRFHRGWGALGTHIRVISGHPNPRVLKLPSVGIGSEVDAVMQRPLKAQLRWKQRTLNAQLQDARDKAEIIRIYRGGLEDGWMDGFIAGIGADFFALQLIDEGCRLDGFCCLRYCDITELKAPAPHADFLQSALLERGIAKGDFPGELTSLPALLQSAGNAFHLLSIFYEIEDDMCYVGKLNDVTDTEVHVLEVSPDGRWDHTPTPHLLAGITRVDFGGAYEEALHLVASAQQRLKR